mgnify:CR=1 FL=1|tara:strand:- start:2449 stop:2688 length:240 start_codon:yes stop_codon:yes gene_type:complete
MSDKYEHKAVRIRKRAGEEAFRAELEKQGAEGWRVYHAEIAGPDRVAYMQRVKPEPKKRKAPVKKAPAKKKAAPKKSDD